MRYGLVSSPVLGFDLARHPHGAAVAQVLRYAVGAGADHVIALAAERRRVAPDRLDVARRAGETSGGSDGLDLARVALDAGDAGSAAHLLAHGLLGGLDAVLAFVAEQVAVECWTWQLAPGAGRGAGGHPCVLDPTTRAAAADVVADAVVGAWSGGGSGGGSGGWGTPRPGGVQAEAVVLTAPFRRARRDVPEQPVDLGPQTTKLAAVLCRLGRLGPADRAALEAVGASAGAGEWARAVHDASWAVHFTHRTEAAACVQLEAVTAVRSACLGTGGGPVGDGGGDGGAVGRAWNVVSGALHALVVADVLTPAPVLVEPWERALGPLAGGTSGPPLTPRP